MATPIAVVGGGNSGREGGSFASAPNPVAVGGTFTSVGAPGFPMPAVGQIAFARNNQGSNVRIPYARYASTNNTPHTHST